MYISNFYHEDMKEQHPCEKVYETHQLVWSLFTHIPGKGRKFIYYLIQGRIIIVSQYRPLLGPEHKNYTLETKVYYPNIQDKMMFQFQVRLNAQIAKGDKKTPLIFDHLNKYRNTDYRNWGDAAYDASVLWFERLSQTYGFKVRNHKVLSFYMNKMTKPDGSTVYYNIIDIIGALYITNQNLFLNTLYHGIGKCKAFGCGLILLCSLS